MSASDPDVGLLDDHEAGAAAELLTRFFTEEGFVVPGEGMVSRLERYRERDGHAVFAARVAGEVVGVATIAAGYSLEYGGVAEIEDLYVSPGWRRQGVARALVERACAWARAAGCSAVLVTVTPEGQAAHDLLAFYGGLGFRDDDRSILERSLG